MAQYGAMYIIELHLASRGRERMDTYLKTDFQVLWAFVVVSLDLPLCTFVVKRCRPWVRFIYLRSRLSHDCSSSYEICDVEGGFVGRERSVRCVDF